MAARNGGLIRPALAGTSTPITGEQLLTAALAMVESESIRAWATTAHNRPLWLEIASRRAAKGGRQADVTALSTYITCQAIGL